MKIKQLLEDIQYNYNISNLLKNIWSFRKELFVFHAFDSDYSLMMLKKALELNKDAIEKYSHAEDKEKYSNQMNKTINLLDIIIKDDYEDDIWQEKKLGVNLLIH